MEARLALTQPSQVNKITTSFEICSGPHDTQYYMEDPERAFVDYASSRTDGMGSRKPRSSNEFHTTVESKEEFGEEIKDEIEEEEEDCPKHFDTFPTMKELRYHEWILKNPRPLWVKAKSQGAKSFIGNFTYECDFMVLEDTTSVIDHDLGSVIFGKPFVEATGLVFDREEGTIMFEKYEEKIMFRMPHKMEMFKHIDFNGHEIPIINSLLS
ncbi:hypothetical protein Tco_0715212 [Tanacetum coccineum]